MFELVMIDGGPEDADTYYSVSLNGILLDYYTSIESACLAIEIIHRSLKEVV